MKILVLLLAALITNLASANNIAFKCETDNEYAVEVLGKKAALFDNDIWDETKVFKFKKANDTQNSYYYSTKNSEYGDYSVQIIESVDGQTAHGILSLKKVNADSDEAMILNCKKADVSTFNYFKNSKDNKVFKGYISGISAGEFDPYLIGDACFILVKLANNKNLGLLTDYDLCIENKVNLFDGRQMKISLSNKNLITDKYIINKLIGKNKFPIYKIDFSDILSALN